jgi:tetratricopeptide (TPR) repeat protein
MSNTKVLWVLRSDRGQLRGPFETEAVLKMIREGGVSGEEKIARYPGGNWISISKEPEFYDHLLGALQNNPEGSNFQNNQAFHKTSDATIVTGSEGQAADSAIDLSAQNPKIVHLQKTEAKPMPPPPKVEIKRPPVIELSNLRKIEKNLKIKLAKPPILALVSVVILALVILLWPSSGSHGKIRLIAPKAGEDSFSADEIKSRTKMALMDIQKDTSDSYLAAQSKLVSLIEGAPRFLPGRALLCMVYNELWPFSYQDQADQKTLTEFSQATKNLNLIGIHGNICEAIKLMTLGRVREARGVVDNMMDNPDDVSFLSLVYVIKAELLSYDHDTNNAMAFYSQAMEKSKDWIKPRIELAFLQLAGKQYAAALENFQTILKMNASHKAAKLGVGLTLYKGYNKADEAFQWIKTGLDSEGRVAREIEADAYFVLATLALQRDDKDLAKSSAAKAYERNPQSEAIKDLLVRLGGMDNLRMVGSQKNELIFLGDQYARQGDCFSAQAQYKTAFDLDPKNGTAAMKAAKCLWQLHQSFEAIEWLKKATQAEPDLVSAYALQADYLSSRYDFSAATQILLSAKRIAPDSYEVLRGMAQVEFRKNNLEGAISYGQKALSLFQGDIDTLILLSQANIFLAKKTLPNTPAEVKKRDDALRDATRFALKALEIDGTHLEANKNYALIMSMTTGVEAGIRILQDLIKKYSFNYEYRVALGDLLRSEQRYAQAQLLYEQVVDADPKNKEAFLGLGECYKTQKETTKSLKAYLSASALDPTDAQPIFEIGRLYLDTQRYDEAIKYFERANKINPNYPRTFYYKGKAAFAAGVFDVAMDAVKAEKKNNPYLSDSYILAGQIHYAQKQYTECASEYAQAMKLRPQSAEVYVRAAQCYRLGGSTEVAEDMLAIAANRESGFAEIYREQGAIFDTKGDRKASVKAYCLYLELSPNAPDKKEVEDRLLNRLGFRAEDCNNK